MTRTFRFKNLMINIGAAEFAPAAGAAYCAYRLAPTAVNCGHYLSPVIYAELQCGITPYCGFTPYKNCERTIIPGFENPYTPVIAQSTPLITDANVLAELKSDLNTAVAEVERQEQVLAKAQTPQTVEEAEMLEQELNAALKEVATVKARLKK